jgi:hypothetical protein
MEVEQNNHDKMDDRSDDIHLDCYQGSYSRIGGSIEQDDYTSLEYKKAILQKVKSKVTTMLENDIPFFTKDAIRDVYQQIQQFTAQKKGEISVKGLDGVVVQFHIEIEKIHEYPAGRNSERIIRYVTYVFLSFFFLVFKVLTLKRLVNNEI